MGGFDNYGADDLYNMEDVWNERSYDQKPQKKVGNNVNFIWNYVFFNL